MSFASVGGAIRQKIETDIPALANKLYPQKMPQGTLVSENSPAIIYRTGAQNPVDDLQGKAALCRANIHFYVHAHSLLEAQTIAKNIRNCLIHPDNGGFRGTVLDVKILGIYVLEETEDFEDEVIEYIEVIRFSVWYRMTTV